MIDSGKPIRFATGSGSRDMLTGASPRPVQRLLRQALNVQKSPDDGLLVAASIEHLADSGDGSK
jgi:hypothetical protein